MKKILLTFTILLFGSISALADTSAGVAKTNYSSTLPTATGTTFTVELSKEVDLVEYGTYMPGTVFTGKIKENIGVKRGKRDAKFIFEPDTATYKGDVRNVKNVITVKVSKYKEFDFQNATESAAQSGVGFALKNSVPFVSQGISFVKGAVRQNNSDNRLASGAKQVYKDSPLSYVEKGEELIIKPGDKVKLIVKVK